MDFYASNIVQHIKRIVYSSIRLGYQYACDYPVVLGAGTLLMVLQLLCPSLFMFLLSSSPVFLLTALLLGALLTYGEPSAAPEIGEETMGNQQTLSRQFKTSSTNCSTEEIENVAVVAYAEKSFENQVVCTEERTFDSIVHDTHDDEEKSTSMSRSTVLCAKEFSEFANHNVIKETEERSEISKNVELQEFESTNSESYYNEVDNRYQLGEFMSSCWQPVMRHDPCSDSESDISGSSSDASMTDIILMLDELNPPVNLGYGHASSTFRNRLNSSSDDEDDSEEDGDHCSDEGAEEKKNDENNSEDNDDVHSSDSLDVEKVSNVDSLMERRRARNILKFELDKRLMDMQAAETVQKMEEASRFRVQVPSISTPRPKPSGPSNGLEETIELPQIPDSAPSVLLPWRKPFDQIVDRERKYQETWTPRSYFPSTQHRKLGNSYMRQSTYLQHHNGVMVQKSEHSRNDVCDNLSDSDSEQTGNHGKLFGSLETHIGEEIKIISAAISDVCVLEGNCEVDEGKKNTNLSDDTYSFCIKESVTRASEEDSIPAGGEKSAECSLSNRNNFEQHIVETDFISEVNLLFKSRMEEVLVQSISESSIGQPLTVKHEDDLSGTLSADSGMPAVEASSVEELNSRISQLTKETLTFDACDHACEYQLVQDRSGGALPEENSSQLPIDDGYDSDYTLDEPTAVKFEGKPNELLTDCGKLPVLETSSVEEMNTSFKKIEDYGEFPVLEANSVEEMNSSFDKIEEEAQGQIYLRSVHNFGQDEGETSSDIPVLEAKSIEDITFASGQLGNSHDINLPQNGELNLDQADIKSGLHVIKGKATNDDDKI